MTLKWYGAEVLKTIRDATPDAMFSGAEELIQAAAAKAPRGATGDLANSGYVSGAGKSTYRMAKNHKREEQPRDDQTVIAGFAVFYAKFIELGTRTQSARPFLRPALDELKGRLGQTIVDHVKQYIK